MDLRGYAQHRKERGLRGATHVAVLHAIQTGRLPASAKMVDGRWQIDAELADIEWATNTRDVAPKTAKDQVARGLQNISGRRDGDRYGPDRDRRDIPDILQAEAMKRAAEAKLKILDLQQREGKLVERADWERSTEVVFRSLRDAVLGIPPRVVDAVCAVVGDLDVEQRHRIRAAIMGECRRVVEDISRAQGGLRG